MPINIRDFGNFYLTYKRLLKFIFPDELSQTKFLDISVYFLGTLKMLKYDFLSFHCFPDPGEHINPCKDFGNVKRFEPKKLDSRPTDTPIYIRWRLFQSYNNN